MRGRGHQRGAQLLGLAQNELAHARGGGVHVFGKQVELVLDVLGLQIGQEPGGRDVCFVKGDEACSKPAVESFPPATSWFLKQTDIHTHLILKSCFAVSMCLSSLCGPGWSN